MAAHSKEKTFLKNYSVHDFDVPLTCVDMAIFTVRNNQLQLLLVKRAEHPCLGQWALPGGIVDIKNDKSLADTAHRKLKEKTGVDTHYLEQVETFSGPKRDPRGWSITIAYLALIASEEMQLLKDTRSDDLAWVVLDEVKDNFKLAFDHQEIVTACHDRLKAKVRYTSLPVNLLPAMFSLSELQKIFEIILGNTLEKKSFRRRIIDANILVDTGHMKTASHRPAKLYRVKHEGKNHYFNRNLEGPR